MVPVRLIRHTEDATVPKGEHGAICLFTFIIKRGDMKHRNVDILTIVRLFFINVLELRSICMYL